MNVLIVSPCDLPVPAVSGGAVATLIESLIKVNDKKKNMKLTVLSSYDLEAEEKSKTYSSTKFEWVKIPTMVKCVDRTIDWMMGTISKTGQSKEYIRKVYVINSLERLLLDNDYDVVVIQNSGYLLKVFRKKNLLQKYNGKIYYHLHNDIPKNADVEVLKHCKFLLISNYLRQGVKMLCGDDALKRCFIVKNGINTQQYNQILQESDKLALLKQLKIQPDKKIVLFVGRIKPEKGLSELLDAIEKMNDSSVVLMIIGSTNFGKDDISSYEKEIQEKCSQLGDKIVFTGFIQNSEIWKYYKLADVAVLPSMWEEPAGLTMIEAAAAGVPVITTNSGGIPEYLTCDLSIQLERNEGIAIKIKEAIEEVLLHSEEWERQVVKAYEYVNEFFSEEVFYQNFCDCLNNAEQKCILR